MNGDIDMADGDEDVLAGGSEQRRISPAPQENSGGKMALPEQAKRHFLTKNDLRAIRKKVGAPWHDRRRRIPVWKIKALRDCGYSYRQVGRVFGVSGSTIRRRLRERANRRSVHRDSDSIS